MLEKLSPRQVEQAFKWLASPVQNPPPKGLEPLSQVEWFLLSRMLDNLLEEKGQSRLQ